jgi:hypothetical protein
MVDYSKTFKELERLIQQVAEAPAPIPEGLEHWFKYCEEVAPQGAALWKQLRRLDYGADAEQMAMWLTNLLKTEPPPSQINGLWFGLFNPVVKDGEASCQMYLSGSESYETDPEDWACDTSYFPKGRYPYSVIMDQIYRITNSSHEGDVSYLGDAFLCLGYAALLVSNWCHGPSAAQLLGDAPLRAVATGHDSGDIYQIALLAQN